MKIAIVGFTIAFVFLCHGLASACSIQNRKEITIGDNRGIEGICSNNGLTISCSFFKGEGINCDGPAGGYSGNDLKSLVYSACG